MIHTLTTANFVLHYSFHQTERCSVLFQDSIYIEAITLPAYFIGKTTMSAPSFYQADCPELKEKDYQLSESFKQILKRFPHTNQRQVQFTENDTYELHQIPIYLKAENYLLGMLLPEKYATVQQELQKIDALIPIYAEDLSTLPSYKRKQLRLDGQYGPRELLAPEHQTNAQQIQHKLRYVNELYSFVHYSYAAMIEFLPEHQITTYEQFHDAYGKYIYSFTLTKNGQTVPLLWPDYLYHQPENHLEFGVLNLPASQRYTLFNDWQAGDEVIIEILAEGFEDVQFKTVLKKQLPTGPKLSKATYYSTETIIVEVTEELIQELQKQEAVLEILCPNHTLFPKEKLAYALEPNKIRISSKQLNRLGNYQLKIISNTYGQLLLLFAVTKEEQK